MDKSVVMLRCYINKCQSLSIATAMSHFFGQIKVVFITPVAGLLASDIQNNNSSYI